MRYAPNRLLIDTAEGLRGQYPSSNILRRLSIRRLTFCALDIYSHRSNVIKADNYDSLVHRAPNTLTQRDKKLHGRKRRVISQGFSDSALRVYEAPVLVQIQKFSAILGGAQNDDGTKREYCALNSFDGWSPPRNVARWCKDFRVNYFPNA